LRVGKKYFLQLNNYVELAFVILNFNSTYLVSNYTLYIVINYLKIINVTRISNIFMFIKRRQKQLLIEKYNRERERLKKK